MNFGGIPFKLGCVSASMIEIELWHPEKLCEDQCGNIKSNACHEESFHEVFLPFSVGI